MDTNIEVIIVSLTTWEAHHSPRAKPRPTQVGGHGSLTCHMTQFERSDLLRSENFINIIIEYGTNKCHSFYGGLAPDAALSI